MGAVGGAASFEELITKTRARAAHKAQQAAPDVQPADSAQARVAGGADVIADDPQPPAAAAVGEPEQGAAAAQRGCEGPSGRRGEPDQEAAAQPVQGEHCAGAGRAHSGGAAALEGLADAGGERLQCSRQEGGPLACCSIALRQKDCKAQGTAALSLAEQPLSHSDVDVMDADCLSDEVPDSEPEGDFHLALPN